MKKIILAFATLFSGSVFASYLAPETNLCPNLISPLSTAPTCGGFYVGLTGLDLIPSETGLGTFSDSWEYANNGGTLALSKPVRVKYRGAYAVQLGYDLPKTASNIELAYFHFHHDTHNINDTSDNPIAFGSVFFNAFIPLVPGQTFVSDFHLKYTVDQFDLDFGRHYQDSCGRFQLHPIIGLRYARLKHELPFAVGHVFSHYHGIGPMLGVDARYNLGCSGFGIAGHFDTAVLAGKVSSESLVFIVSELLAKQPSIHRAVYTAEGQLGVNYTFNFCNRSSLLVEAGFQETMYFNPFDTISAWSFPPEGPRIANIQTNTFSYSGPYVNVTWHL